MLLTSVRSWPDSAGDISLWARGTSDTNAADDDDNLCNDSCRQAILQAFQDSAAIGPLTSCWRPATVGPVHWSGMTPFRQLGCLR